MELPVFPKIFSYPPFYLISLFTPLCKFLHDRPCFLLPFGFHCTTCTCLTYMGCLCFMSSVIVRRIFMISLILILVALSIVDLPTAFLQKSISTSQTSEAYVTILFTMVLYFRYLFSFKMLLSHEMLFSIALAFLTYSLRSQMALRSIPRYFHFKVRVCVRHTVLFVLSFLFPVLVACIQSRCFMFAGILSTVTSSPPFPYLLLSCLLLPII